VGALLEQAKLPLISAYCSTNLSDPTARKDTIAKSLVWAKLVKKYNGKVIVVGPNGVKRDTYDFKAHKNDIVATLNELGKAVTDMGLTPVLHQHTGTCVESRDETRSDGIGGHEGDEVRARHRPVTRAGRIR
jgi:inosose dehydratase